MTDYLIYTGLIFLVVFAVLSLLDGVYLHLIVYKLPENPESKFEHLTHTLRAILFLPIILTIFYWNLSGPMLLIATGIIIADLIIEAFDVISERKSRKNIGGLSDGEYLLHVTLTTTRVAAITLFLASKPKDAWFASLSLAAYPEVVRTVVWNLIPGAILITILHIALIIHPTLISKVEGMIKRKYLRKKL